MGSTPPPLAGQLIDNYPDIEAVLRINTPGGYEVRYQHAKRGLLVYQEESVLAADSNFFEFFHVPLLSGDPQTALYGKNKVVLTAEMSEKYFGTEDALGKTLLFGPEKIPTLVSGVTHSLATNMHFSFDFLLSMPSNPNVKQFDWSWIWTQVVTYAKIKPGASLSDLSANVTAGLNPQIRSVMDRIGMDYEDFMKDKGSWGFDFQPVREIHLHSLELGNRIGSLGDIKAVNILRLLAFLILLMAVINFINLSTARAKIRSKEVGVKKTMGAPTTSLAVQFQMESITMTLLAGIISLPLLMGISVLVSSQTGIIFSLQSLLGFTQITALILLLIAIGFCCRHLSLFLSVFLQTD